MSKQLAKTDGYKTLVKKIQVELTELDFFIRRRTAETYWKIGKFIHNHLLENKNRADYGKYIYDLLADDLGREKSTLHRAVKFYLDYPIVGGCPQLSWSHYRKLITVQDKDERKKLEAKIIQKGWNSEQLQEYLNTKRALEAQKSGGQPIPKLEFTRGKLFIYKVIEVVDAQSQQTTRRLDLGFKVGRPFQDDFKKGGFVEVRGVNQECSLKEANASLDEIFTYKAQALKIIDGDTLTVDMDTGLNEFIGKKLRLRGIDCPEMDTEEGKRAKRFVESRLKDCEFIIVKTHKDQSDMWDRYLADVFYLKDEARAEVVLENGNFLNQELLDKGLARLWE